MCASERSERALKIYILSLGYKYTLHVYTIQNAWWKFVGGPFCGGPWAAAHSASPKSGPVYILQVIRLTCTCVINNWFSDCWWDYVYVE